MKEFFSSFSTREASLSIWILIIIFSLFILSALNKNLLESFKDVLKSFFQKPIVISTVLFFSYILIIILGLNKLGLWDFSLLKDTIIWTFGSAFILLANFSKITEPFYFKGLIKDTVKGIIIIEFITDFYTFNFWTEFLLIPFITFISILQIFAKRNPEHEILDKVIGKLLGFIGVLIFCFVLYKTFTQYKDLLTLDNLRSFLLPIVFTLLFIPFIYFLAVCDQYLFLFNRVNHLDKNKASNKNKKLLLIKICKIDLGKLTNVIRYSWELDLPNIKEYLSEISIMGSKGRLYREKNYLD